MKAQCGNPYQPTCVRHDTTLQVCHLGICLQCLDGFFGPAFLIEAPVGAHRRSYRWPSVLRSTQDLSVLPISVTACFPTFHDGWMSTAGTRAAAERSQGSPFLPPPGRPCTFLPASLHERGGRGSSAHSALTALDGGERDASRPVRCQAAPPPQKSVHSIVHSRC